MSVLRRIGILELSKRDNIMRIKESQAPNAELLHLPESIQFSILHSQSLAKKAKLDI